MATSTTLRTSSETNNYAFAALKSDGSVVTWGTSAYGGNSSSVQAQLTNVNAIYSAPLAFAALKTDGTVVPWGGSGYGGDGMPSSLSSATANGFSKVVNIASSGYAFAALRENGTVVSWGNTTYGGAAPAIVSNSSTADFVAIKAIYSNYFSFVAVLTNNKAIAWGFLSSTGGTYGSAALSQSLTDVKAVYTTAYAYAALKNNGTVVAWGFSTDGGSAPNSVTDSADANFVAVEVIYANAGAFAALRTDGTVVAWGNSSNGNTAPSGLSNVKSIYVTNTAFAALKTDGTVVAWGSATDGGTVPSALTSSSTANVKTIYSTNGAFAALKTDGTVVVWGNSTFGSDSSGVQSQLTNIRTIFSSYNVFVALKTDGTVVAWGNANEGGTAPSGLSNVEMIYSTGGAFAALKTDGTVVAWGSDQYGGYAAQVQSQLTNVARLTQGITSHQGVLYHSSIPVGMIDRRYLLPIPPAETTLSIKTDSRNGLVFNSNQPGTISCSFNGNNFSFIGNGAVVPGDNIVRFSADIPQNFYPNVVVKVTTSDDIQPGKLTRDVLIDYGTSTFSNDGAFAILKADGTVVAWGDSGYGGSIPSSEQNTLTNVNALYSTQRAFAALRADGSVRTWGAGTSYGSGIFVSNNQNNQYNPVVNIYSTDRAFAALKRDGTVIAWGDSDYGGNQNDVPASISANNANYAKTIYSNAYAFAALRKNGLSVVAWGDQDKGGNAPSNLVTITDGYSVTHVSSTSQAFAALKSNRTVVVWGNSVMGGGNMPAGLSNVIAIYSTAYAFAALKSTFGNDSSIDGTVVSWGYYIGNNSGTSVPNGLTGVKNIYSTSAAFAALKQDGTVAAWGRSDMGGSVPSELSGVKTIASTQQAFAALKTDGTVVSWGNYIGTNGGTVVPTGLTGVKSIFSNNFAFAALKTDGSVVTWGRNGYNLSSSLTGVITIYSNRRAFAALKTDGTVVAWGNGASGVSPSIQLPTNTIANVRFAQGRDEYEGSSIEGHGRYSVSMIDRRFPLPSYPPEFNLSQVTPIPASTTDTTPSYVFNSNRISTIELSDLGFSTSSITTVGNNTITFNTLANGTYTGKQIFVAYGLEFPPQILTIPTFIIDTNPPNLSQVTAITTPSSDTTPSYVFSSNQIGTISSNLTFSTTTSAIIGNNTITFSALEDGTYTGKTVTVKNDGNLSTTLTIPDFTIETIGPNLTQITAIATPTLDNTPSYVFKSNKAGQITSNLSFTSTTSAIVGNNTITFSSLPVGTYSGKFVTVTTLSNLSTTIVIPTFVITGDIPSLKQVTAITSPTADTTPSYVFSSNQAGTIESNLAFTSTTTAVVGNNTITFATLSQGTYTGKTVTVKNAANSTSAPLTIPDFVINTSAPVLTQVTAIPTPSNDTTPSFIFNTNAPGTITSNLSFVSSTIAIIGNNTITFDTLNVGSYSGKTITVTNAAGNSATLTIPDFVIQKSEVESYKEKQKVHSVTTNERAHAIVTSAGTVINWGADFSGGQVGTSSDPQNHAAMPLGLNNVKAVYSTSFAFAALKNNGTVVVWGDLAYGGMDETTQGGAATVYRTGAPLLIIPKPNGLNNVVEISSTSGAFAALKNDGSIVAWGHRDKGGSTKYTRGIGSLSDSWSRIYANGYAFTAVKDDTARIICWGGGATLIDSNNTGKDFMKAYFPDDRITMLNKYATTSDPVYGAKVVEIFHTENAFCALFSNRALLPWGSWEQGGAYQNQPTTYTKTDGQTVTHPFVYSSSNNNQEDFTFLPENHTDTAGNVTNFAVKVYATKTAFLVITHIDAAVAWGSKLRGGDLSVTTQKSISNSTDLSNIYNNESNIQTAFPISDSTRNLDNGGNNSLTTSSSYHMDAFLLLGLKGRIFWWGTQHCPAIFAGDGDATFDNKDGIGKNLEGVPTEIFSYLPVNNLNNLVVINDGNPSPKTVRFKTQVVYTVILVGGGGGGGAGYGSGDSANQRNNLGGNGGDGGEVVMINNVIFEAETDYTFVVAIGGFGGTRGTTGSSSFNNPTPGGEGSASYIHKSSVTVSGNDPYSEKTKLVAGAGGEYCIARGGEGGEPGKLLSNGENTSNSTPSGNFKSGATSKNGQTGDSGTQSGRDSKVNKGTDGFELTYPNNTGKKVMLGPGGGHGLSSMLTITSNYPNTGQADDDQSSLSTGGQSSSYSHNSLAFFTEGGSGGQGYGKVANIIDGQTGHDGVGGGGGGGGGSYNSTTNITAATHIPGNGGNGGRGAIILIPPRADIGSISNANLLSYTNKIKHIYTAGAACAILRADNTISKKECWGGNVQSHSAVGDARGGVYDTVASPPILSMADIETNTSNNWAHVNFPTGLTNDKITDVFKVYSNRNAFVVMKSDRRTIVTWGNKVLYGSNKAPTTNQNLGGDASVLTTYLSNNASVTITDVHASQYSFFAILSNGAVITWGYSPDGSGPTSLLTANPKMIAGFTNKYSHYSNIAQPVIPPFVKWGSTGTVEVNVGKWIHSPPEMRYTSNVPWEITVNGGSTWIQYDINSTNEIKVPIVLDSNGNVIAYGDNKIGIRTINYEDVKSRTVYSPTNYTSCAELYDYWNNYGSDSASAGIQYTGNVVVWGNSDLPVGRDGSKFIRTSGTSGVAVSNQELGHLRNKGAVRVYANKMAMVALFEDGTFICWGEKTVGGQFPPQNNISLTAPTKVRNIYSTAFAFVALDATNKLTVWGGEDSGGGGYHVTVKDIENVIDVFPGYKVFTALTKNGHLAVWGDVNFGGINSSINYYVLKDQNGGKITDIVSVYFNGDTTGGACAALTTSKNLYVWGNVDYGGENKEYATLKATNVKEVKFSALGWTVLKTDGTLLTWGNVTDPNANVDRPAPIGAPSSAGVLTAISNSTRVSYDTYIESSDSYVLDANGFPGLSGNASFPPKTVNDLTNIQSIYSTSQAFCAVDNQGDIYCWGEEHFGGYPHKVAGTGYTTTATGASLGLPNPIANEQLAQKVQHVYSNDAVFAALRTKNVNGTIRTSVRVWGDIKRGGFINDSERAMDANNETYYNRKNGGHFVKTSDQTTVDVKDVYSTQYGFIALPPDDAANNNGTPIMWGGQANQLNGTGSGSGANYLPMNLIQSQLFNYFQLSLTNSAIKVFTTRFNYTFWQKKENRVAPWGLAKEFFLGSELVSRNDGTGTNRNLPPLNRIANVTDSQCITQVTQGRRYANGMYRYSVTPAPFFTLNTEKTQIPVASDTTGIVTVNPAYSFNTLEYSTDYGNNWTTLSPTGGTYKLTVAFGLTSPYTYALRTKDHRNLYSKIGYNLFPIVRRPLSPTVSFSKDGKVTVTALGNGATKWIINVAGNIKKGTTIPTSVEVGTGTFLPGTISVTNETADQVQYTPSIGNPELIIKRPKKPSFTENEYTGLLVLTSDFPVSGYVYSIDGGLTWSSTQRHKPYGIMTYIQLPGEEGDEYIPGKVLFQNIWKDGTTSAISRNEKHIILTDITVIPGPPEVYYIQEGRIQYKLTPPARHIQFSVDSGETWLEVPDGGNSFKLPPGEYKAGEVKVRNYYDIRLLSESVVNPYDIFSPFKYIDKNIQMYNYYINLFRKSDRRNRYKTHLYCFQPENVTLEFCDAGKPDKSKLVSKEKGYSSANTKTNKIVNLIRNNRESRHIVYGDNGLSSPFLESESSENTAVSEYYRSCAANSIPIINGLRGGIIPAKMRKNQF
jgi:alpha-tubulin suppressor-like RCC1 family protein